MLPLAVVLSIALALVLTITAGQAYGDAPALAVALDGPIELSPGESGQFFLAASLGGISILSFPATLTVIGPDGVAVPVLLNEPGLGGYEASVYVTEEGVYTVTATVTVGEQKESATKQLLVRKPNFLFESALTRNQDGSLIDGTVTIGGRGEVVIEAAPFATGKLSDKLYAQVCRMPCDGTCTVSCVLPASVHSEALLLRISTRQAYQYERFSVIGNGVASENISVERTSGVGEPVSIVAPLTAQLYAISDGVLSLIPLRDGRLSLVPLMPQDLQVIVKEGEAIVAYPVSIVARSNVVAPTFESASDGAEAWYVTPISEPRESLVQLPTSVTARNAYFLSNGTRTELSWYKNSIILPAGSGFLEVRRGLPAISVAEQRETAYGALVRAQGLHRYTFPGKIIAFNEALETIPVYWNGTSSVIYALNTAVAVVTSAGGSLSVTDPVLPNGELLIAYDVSKARTTSSIEAQSTDAAATSADTVFTIIATDGTSLMRQTFTGASGKRSLLAAVPPGSYLAIVQGEVQAAVPLRVLAADGGLSFDSAKNTTVNENSTVTLTHLITNGNIAQAMRVQITANASQAGLVVLLDGEDSDSDGNIDLLIEPGQSAPISARVFLPPGSSGTRVTFTASTDGGDSATSSTASVTDSIVVKAAGLPVSLDVRVITLGGTAENANAVLYNSFNAPLTATLTIIAGAQVGNQTGATNTREITLAPGMNNVSIGSLGGRNIATVQVSVAGDLDTSNNFRTRWYNRLSGDEVVLITERFGVSHEHYTIELPAAAGKVISWLDAAGQQQRASGMLVATSDTIIWDLGAVPANTEFFATLILGSLVPVDLRVVLDNGDARVRSNGVWASGTTIPGYVGFDYLIDLNLNKGSAVEYSPGLARGQYSVSINTPADPSLASNAQVIITGARRATVTVNQRQGGEQYLGLYELNPASTVSVSNAGTSELVVVDALTFIPITQIGEVKLLRPVVPIQPVVIVNATNATNLTLPIITNNTNVSSETNATEIIISATEAINALRNATVNDTQSRAIIGERVQWTRIIEITDNSNETNITLPSTVLDVIVETRDAQTGVRKDITQTVELGELRRALRENELPATAAANAAPTLDGLLAENTVSDVKRSLEAQGELTGEDAKSARVDIIEAAQTLSEQPDASQPEQAVTLGALEIIVPSAAPIDTSTGTPGASQPIILPVVSSSQLIVEDQVLSIIPDLPIGDLELSVPVTNDAESLVITYETEAPQLTITEQTADRIALVVSAETHYTAITSFLDVTPFTAAQQSKYELFRTTAGVREPVVFTTQDMNADGKFDRLVWIVPHLSNQTYELSLSILNPLEYLRDGETWTVFFNTTGTGNLTVFSPNANWSELFTDTNGRTEEMVLLSMACGNTDLSNSLTIIATNGSQYAYNAINSEDSIDIAQLFIENYNCDDQTGELKNVMTVAGYAVLNFTFTDGTITQSQLAVDPLPIEIGFTNPTPQDGAVVNANNFTVNISINNTNLLGFSYLWNGTNYTIYNDTALQVMFNFDNLTALGESATQAIDVSRNAISANIVGSATPNTTGVVRQGMSFYGTTGIVNTSVNLTTWLGRTATLSLWMRTTQTGSANPWTAPGITGIEQGAGGDDIFWGWINVAGNINMQAGNGANAASTIAINDGAWRHYTFTRDETTGTVNIYIDGILNATAASEAGRKTLQFSGFGVITDTAGPASDDYFAGDMDEIRVWNRTLNASEAYQSYLSSLNKIGVTQWMFVANQTGLGEAQYDIQGCAANASLVTCISRSIGVNTSVAQYNARVYVWDTRNTTSRADDVLIGTESILQVAPNGTVRDVGAFAESLYSYSNYLVEVQIESEQLYAFDSDYHGETVIIANNSFGLLNNSASAEYIVPTAWVTNDATETADVFVSTSTNVDYTVDANTGEIGRIIGDPDATVLVSGADDIFVYTNPSSNKFGAAWTEFQADADIGTTTTENIIQGGDFDLDGDLDLLIGNNLEDLRIFENDGTPFAGAWTELIADANVLADTYSVVVADIDRDGYPDICGGTVGQDVYCFNNSDRTPFVGAWTRSTVELAAGGDVNSLASGDMDNDGDTDLVGAVAGVFDISWWSNDGSPYNGAWTIADIDAATGLESNVVVVADFDNDGFLDVAQGDDDEDVDVYCTGGVAGAWTEFAASANVGGDANAMAVGDVDNDGDVDIIIGVETANDVVYLENDGSPCTGAAWTQRTISADTTDTPWGVSVADIDGDGWLDVFASINDQDVMAFHNDGTPANGAWTAVDIDIAAGNVAAAIYAGDLDNDDSSNVIDFFSSAGENAENASAEMTGWNNLAAATNYSFYFIANPDYDFAENSTSTFTFRAGNESSSAWSRTTELLAGAARIPIQVRWNWTVNKAKYTKIDSIVLSSTSAAYNSIVNITCHAIDSTSDQNKFEWYNYTIGFFLDGVLIGRNITNSNGTAVFSYNFTNTATNAVVLCNATDSANFDFSVQNLNALINITNSPPTHTTPILNSSTIRNLSSENITVYNQSTADVDSPSVTNTYNWYESGNPISLLNLPFNTILAAPSTYGAIRDYARGNNATCRPVSGNCPNSSGFGKVGASVRFGGGGEAIDVGNSSDFVLGENYTIMLWAYPTVTPAGTNNYRLVSRQNGGAGGWEFIMRSSVGGATRTLRFDNGPSDTSIVGAWGSNQWQHFAVTNNVTTFTFYVNGTAWGTGTAGATSYNNLNLTLGQTPDGTGVSFAGYMDEVRIYNRSLPASQVYRIWLEGNNSINTSTIVAGDTRGGQTYYACVTPNDNASDGTTLCSNNLTVVGGVDVLLPGNHTILDRDSQNATHNDSVVLNLTTYDPFVTITFRANLTDPSGLAQTNLVLGQNSSDVNGQSTLVFNPNSSMYAGNYTWWGEGTNYVPNVLGSFVVMGSYNISYFNGSTFPSLNHTMNETLEVRWNLTSKGPESATVLSTNYLTLAVSLLRNTSGGTNNISASYANPYWNATHNLTNLKGVGVWNSTINGTATYFYTNTTSKNVTILSNMNVTGHVLNASSIDAFTQSISRCSVLDSITNYAVANVNVSFYRNGTLIGTNLTNATGNVTLIHQINQSGSYIITCNISNQTEIFYYRGIEWERNASLTVLPYAITPWLPTNNSRVDRDSVDATDADSVVLRLNTSTAAVPAGTVIDFRMNLTDPTGVIPSANSSNVLIGSNITNATGGTSFIFNPNSTSYAGNWSWYGNSSSGYGNGSNTIIIMGGLNATYRNTTFDPNASYNQTSLMLIQVNISTYGPENLSALNATYNISVNNTLYNTSGSLITTNLVFNGSVFWNRTINFSALLGVGRWNITASTGGKFFYLNFTNRTTDVFGFMNVSANYTSPASPTAYQSMITWCNISDRLSNYRIPGITVDFYRNGTFIGTNTTNSTGESTLTHTINASGNYHVWCNITNQTSLFYFVGNAPNGTMAVTVTPVPITMVAPTNATVVDRDGVDSTDPDVIMLNATVPNYVPAGASIDFLGNLSNPSGLGQTNIIFGSNLTTAGAWVNFHLNPNSSTYAGNWTVFGNSTGGTSNNTRSFIMKGGLNASYENDTLSPNSAYNQNDTAVVAVNVTSLGPESRSELSANYGIALNNTFQNTTGSRSGVNLSFNGTQWRNTTFNLLTLKGVGIWNTTSNSTGTYWYSNWTNRTIAVYGFMNITSNSTTPASIVAYGTTLSSCSVIDQHTNYGVSGATVTFFLNGTFLGSNSTNASGITTLTHSVNATGTYGVQCNVTNQTGIFYFRGDEFARNTSLTVTPYAINVSSPVNGTAVDRDSVDATDPDSIMLNVSVPSSVPSGVLVYFNVNITSPAGILPAQTTITLGSNNTTAGNWANIYFNPNATMYAGNYTWWGNSSAGVSGQVRNFLVYGGLNATYTSGLYHPNGTYNQTDIARIETNVTSFGPENASALNLTYGINVNNTIYNTSGSTNIVNLTNGSTFWNGTHTLSALNGVGTWNTTTAADSIWFYRNWTNRSFVVFGFMNITVNTSTPASISAFQTTISSCTVLDRQSNAAVAGATVTFYLNGTYLGANNTNATGITTITHAVNTSGTYGVQCNITNQTAIFYLRGNEFERNSSLTVIPYVINATTAANGTAVDRDGAYSLDPDNVMLNVSVPNYVPSGTYIEFRANLTNPNGIVPSQQNISLGGNNTTAGNWANIYFNPNLTMYAGNYTWWGNSSAGVSGQVKNILVYGSFAVVYRNNTYHPNATYNQTDTATVQVNVTSNGPEVDAELASNYSAVLSSRYMNSSGTISAMVMSYVGPYWNGSHLLTVLPGVNRSNSSINATANWFYSNGTNRTMLVYGYMNVTANYSSATSVTTYQTIISACSVSDQYSNYSVPYASVSFYVNGTFIGTNGTNSVGNTSISHSINQTGVYTVTCNVTDLSPLFYYRGNGPERNTTITVTPVILQPVSPVNGTSVDRDATNSTLADVIALNVTVSSVVPAGVLVEFRGNLTSPNGLSQTDVLFGSNNTTAGNWAILYWNPNGSIYAGNWSWYANLSGGVPNATRTAFVYGSYNLTFTSATVDPNASYEKPGVVLVNATPVMYGPETAALLNSSYNASFNATIIRDNLTQIATPLQYDGGDWNGSLALITTDNRGTYDARLNGSVSWLLLVNASNRTFEVQNVPPTQGSPTLIASDNPLNLSSAFLFAQNQSTTDAEGDTVSNIYAWSIDGAPYATVQMPFEGGSNSTYAEDYSGNGYDGAVGSSVTWNSTGGVNSRGAYYFGPVNGGIDLGDRSEIDGTTALTVAMWVKNNDLTDDGTLLSKGTFVAGQPLLLWRDEVAFNSGRTDTYSVMLTGNSGELRLETSTGSGNTIAWQHIAIAYTANSTQGIRFYINGVEDAQSPLSTVNMTSLDSNALSLLIGKPTTTLAKDFDGRIDDVRIYNRTLSLAQIRQIMLEGNSTTWNATIVSNETQAYQTWQACVTANDGANESSRACSNTVTINPTLVITSPANETPVDRDSASAVDADSINLVVNADGDSGINVTYWGNLTSPIIGGQTNLFLGSAVTNITGTAVLAFNPNSSYYAGNWTWWPNATNASSQSSATIGIYGGLSIVHANASGTPGVNQTQNETFELRFNLSSTGGPETRDILNATYGAALSTRIANTSNFSRNATASYTNPYWNATQVATSLAGVGNWSSTGNASAQWFYVNSTTRNFTLLGLMNVTIANVTLNTTTVYSTFNIRCTVVAQYSNYTVSGANVSFYRGAQLLGTNVTNSAGLSSFAHTINTTGVYALTCNVSDQPSISYVRGLEPERNISINVTEYVVQPVAPANNTALDRDSANATMADLTDLNVTVDSVVPNGVRIEWYANLTNPAGIAGQTNIFLGNNTTVASGATLWFNPNSTRYAGNYTWWANGTGGTLNGTRTFLVYGQLTSVFENGSFDPNANYTQNGTATLRLNLTSSGPETRDQISANYAATANASLLSPLSGNNTTGLSYASPVWSGSALFIPPNSVGVWNATATAWAAWFFNSTTVGVRNTTVYGYMNVTSGLVSPSTIVAFSSTTSTCRVQDQHTNRNVSGATVSIFLNGTLLGSNTTNATGYTTLSYVQNSTGVYTVSCNVSNQTSIFYYRGDAPEQNATLTVIPFPIDAVAPANDTVLDRDSVNTMDVDFVMLNVTVPSSVIDGVRIDFRGNLTTPSGLAQTNILFGNNTTLAGSAVLWFNPNATIYAGNWTWYANASSGTSNATLTVLVYGGLNTSYRNSSFNPNSSYNQTDSARIEVNLTSFGPESRDEINASYGASARNTIANTSGYTTNETLSYTNPFWNGTQPLSGLLGVGTWTTLANSSANFFYRNVTNKTFVLYGFANVTSNSTSPALPTAFQSITSTCGVRDQLSGYSVAGSTVSFYRNGTLIGANTTNATGTSTLTHTINVTGTYIVTCNISDQPAILYFKGLENERNVTVTVVGFAINVTSPANGTPLDRDSGNGSMADTVVLNITVPSYVPNGVRIDFLGNLTTPAGLSQTNILLGNNTTVGGSASFLFNPNSTLYAGNWTWFGNNSNAYSNIDGYLHVYGQLTAVFQNGSFDPNVNYTQNATATLRVNVTSSGPETRDQISANYGAAANASLISPLNGNNTTGLAYSTPVWSGSALFMPPNGVGVWNATATAWAAWFFNSTTVGVRNTTVYGFMNITSNTTSASTIEVFESATMTCGVQDQHTNVNVTGATVSFYRNGTLIGTNTTNTTGRTTITHSINITGTYVLACNVSNQSNIFYYRGDAPLGNTSITVLPFALNAVSPANDTAVDRDSVDSTDADVIMLNVTVRSTIPDGVRIDFIANLTTPNGLGQNSIVFGNNTTVGGSAVLYFNPNASIYAGNWTWYGNNSQGFGNTTRTVAVYGGLVTTYRNALQHPNGSYNQTDSARIEVNLTSSGPESRDQINASYGASVRNTIANTSGYTTNATLSYTNPFWNGTHLLSQLYGVGTWSTIANSSANYFYRNVTNKTFVLYGFANVTSNTSLPTSIMAFEVTTASCGVQDQLSGYSVAGSTVSFYRNGTLLGTNATNATGFATLTHSINTTGTYTITCNISDQPAILYFRGSEPERNSTVTVTPFTITPTSPANNTAVDRDSGNASMVDVVVLTVAVPSVVPNGVRVDFRGNLTSPAGLGQAAVLFGNNTTSGGIATLYFNPNSSIYAGNWSWYGNASNGDSNGSLTVLVYGQLTAVYNSATTNPNVNYTENESITVQANVTSAGPETRSELNSSYATVTNATFERTSGNASYALTYNGSLWNRTIAINLPGGPGVWNSTVDAQANWFFMNASNRTLVVYGIMNVTNSTSSNAAPFAYQSFTSSCSVQNQVTSVPVNGATVSFYRNGILIGLNSTNLTGNTSLTHAINVTGSYTITCNVTDQPAISYFRGLEPERNTSVSVVAFPITPTAPANSTALDRDSANTTLPDDATFVLTVPSFIPDGVAIDVRANLTVPGTISPAQNAVLFANNTTSSGSITVYFNPNASIYAGNWSWYGNSSAGAPNGTRAVIVFGQLIIAYENGTFDLDSNYTQNQTVTVRLNITSAGPENRSALNASYGAVVNQSLAAANGSRIARGLVFGGTTWRNDTLLIPAGGVGVWNASVDASANYFIQTSNNTRNTTVYGFANVSSISLISSPVEAFETMIIACSVIDSHTSAAVAGLNVSVYAGGSFVASNLTNASGNVTVLYTPTVQGLMNITCNATSNLSLFYYVLQANVSATLNVTPISLTPESPANDTIVDRDGVSALFADQTLLVTRVKAGVPNGILVEVWANRTDPLGLPNGTIYLGSNVTTDTYVNLTIDPNSTMYAGNWTWSMNNSGGIPNGTRTLLIYGGINVSYELAADRPRLEYNESDTALLYLAASSFGFENATVLNQTYNLTLNLTLLPPIGGTTMPVATSNGTVWNATQNLFTYGVGVWNTSAIPVAKYFFTTNYSLRNFTVYGFIGLSVFDSEEYFNGSIYSNSLGRYYANATNSTGGTITDANCTIRFFDRNATMVYNGTRGLYDNTTAFSLEGVVNYTVTCAKLFYNPNSTTANASIRSAVNLTVRWNVTDVAAQQRTIIINITNAQNYTEHDVFAYGFVPHGLNASYSSVPFESQIVNGPLASGTSLRWYLPNITAGSSSSVNISVNGSVNLTNMFIVGVRALTTNTSIVY